MNRLKLIASNDDKLIFWGERISNIKLIPRPIMLSISLTGKCNWNCEFCWIKEKQKIELNYKQLKRFIRVLSVNGLKGVELSGGEPTLYTHINELIEFCFKLGLRVGLITNGSFIRDEDYDKDNPKILKRNLEKLDWVRVSINRYYDLDELPTWSIRNPFFGLNFIYHKRYNIDKVDLKKLQNFVNNNMFCRYLRVVLDRLADDETREKFKQLKNELKGTPKIVFQDNPKGEEYKGECFCGYIKPILEYDGYVYNCIRELELYGHNQYRAICNIMNPEKLLDYVDIEKDCKTCYNKSRNEFVKTLISGFHKEFV